MIHKPSSKRYLIQAILLLMLSAGHLLACRYCDEGLPVEWTQPDGTKLNLKVKGGLFMAHTETEDGYTVVYNPTDKSYHHAQLSPDGRKLVPSGRRVDRKAPPAGFKKHLRLPDDVGSKIFHERYERFAPNERANWKKRLEAVRKRRGLDAGEPAIQNNSGDSSGGATSQSSSSPNFADVVGNYVGLTILVQFPDDPATTGTVDPTNFPTTKAAMENFCNQIGYTGGSNTGSVRDYFLAQSLGQTDYTQVVTEIVTLPQPRAYYNWSDYPTNATLRDGGLTGRLVLNDAITILKNQGFDFSGLTRNGSNQVIATNVLFAGATSGVWPDGLWPHRWVLSPSVNVGTTQNPIYIYDYQITNAANSNVPIGTFCHENGHLLLKYPDLYDYGNDGASRGVGNHCLMGGGNHLNSGRTPAPINGYFKDAVGWSNVVDITTSQNFTDSLPTTNNEGYRYRKPGTSTEYFFIENRGTGDPWAQYVPDKGILVWHIDELVNGNENQHMTSAKHYEVSLVQADGLYDLEFNRDGGDAADAFDSGNVAGFSDTTSPDAKWWDGSNSGVNLAFLSAAGANMDVRFGLAANTVSLISPNGGEFVYLGATRDITWSANITGNVKIELFKGGVLHSVLAANEANDGIYSWSVSAGLTSANDYTIKITSVDNSAYSDVSNANFTIMPAPTLADALDTTGLTWSTTGNATWFPQSTTTKDGLDAAESGNITHSQTSSLETTLTGPGTLTFWWKVSSEGSYDWLEFYLNNVLQTGDLARIAGEVDWVQKTVTIPSGSQPIKWTFRKDGSVDAGADTAWVDMVTYTPSNAPEIAVEQPVGTDLTDGSATVNFGSVTLGASSSPFTFTIRNTGNTNLTGLAVSKTGTHSADYTVGALGATTLSPGTSTTFNVTFTPGATGTRAAALQIASNDPNENPFDINLTGAGTPVGTLDVTTGGLASSGNYGGPFSPSSKIYTLTNVGSTSINWTAAKTQSWVTLSATSGTLAAGANTTVTASINSNANTLGVNAYADTVTFTNTTNGNGNTTRAVDLTVNPAPATVTLGNLNQFHDGGQKPVTVTTTPGGLSHTVTYNGSSTAPSNAGSYAVVATITQPNYSGSANGTLVIGYSVNYLGNGNTSGSVPATQTKLQDVSLTLSTNSGSLTKTGHTFVGWNTSADGSGTFYSAGSTYSVNAAVTLHAQWIIGTYLTWDANGTTANQTNGGGGWADVGKWWNGTSNQDWVSGASATFGGANTAGGAVTLAAPTTVENFTFNQFTGTYTLGSSGQTITLNSGIAKNSTSAAVTFASPIALGGDQTWTNSSSGTLLTGNGTNLITNNGYQLTIDGSGTTNFGVINNVAATLSGSGALIKNGAGRFNVGGLNSGFTGAVSVNGGVLQAYNDSGMLGTGNLALNGGVLSFYWGTTYTRALGTGDGAVQIPGGESGFGGAGSTGPTVNLGATLVWGASGQGSATGQFNPSKFVLGDAGTTNAGVITFSSGIDLNGATRTITVPAGLNAGLNRSTISGAISNSAGTGNLIKEGGGMLFLTANPTYNGTTTIQEGFVDFAALNLSGMGGGAGVRSISVAAGAIVRRNTLDNAFLNRLVETTSEFTVMTGTTANNLDFSSSTGANLPNAFLGNWASNGAKAEYSGTLTPASDAYRLGGKGGSGLLGIVGTNKLTGNRGLLVGTSSGGGRVELAGANDFTGTTEIRSGARLTLSNNLALQNSPLNLGSAGGTFSLSDGLNASRITGGVAAPSPTFGGLIGSRNLLTAFSGSSGGNNESVLAATAVTGFTLNPGLGVSCTYSGTIGEFATGTTLTKSGQGTQILSGTNTYTGTTTVSAGKLVIDGSLSNVAAALNVAGGATLGGTGSIGRNVTVADGGKLEFDISTNAGSHNPLDISSGRDFTFAGTSTLTITSASGAAPGVYTLITGGNNISGVAPTTLVLPVGWAATVSTSGNSLLLNVTSTQSVTAGSLAVTGAGGLSSSGYVGGPFTPGSLQYTLSNPGQTSIDWTAGNTAAWVNLSSTSGTLAAGANTTVTVFINSNANSLGAGSYNDTVTFSNTTNGTGDTTRGVALAVNAVPTYTVSYNGNGNTGGSAPSNQIKTQNVDLVLSGAGTLVRSGYNFAGWNTAANGSGTAYSAGATYTANASVTLYAQWTAATYTVTFSGNGGGTPSPASKSVTFNSTYGTLATVTRTGYTFNGWFTAASGGTQVTSGTTVTATADHTLHAQWTANSYTVTFDPNGGGTPSPASKSVTYNSTYGALATVARTGYTFNGWFTSASGGTQVTSGTTVNTAGNHTLHAQWTASTCTVTFNSNGGEAPTPTSKSVTYDATYGTLATATRTGHTFNGWFTAASGGTQVTSGTTVTATADHTLYAQWTINTYMVSYSGNGNTSGTAPGAQTKTHDVDLTLATNTGGLARTGYTFSGWNTSTDGAGTNYAEGANYTTNSAMTLYAKWTANSYTVSFDANGGDTPIPSGKSVTYGSTYGTLATTNRTGYSFNGWFTAASGGTQVSTSTTVATASNHTLYAQWTANTYVVSYDGNGNTGGAAPANQSKSHDADLILSDAGSLVRSGFSFTGWNTMADGSGVSYAAGATYTANAAVALYAQWGATPTLALDIAATSISEDGGSSSVTVTRNSPTTSELIVSLSASPSGKISIPSSVTIPAGATSASFVLTAANDGVSGTNNVTLTATAASHADGTDTVSVTDAAVARLKITLNPTSISESGGSVTATLQRIGAGNGGLTVNLSSSDISKATVPAIASFSGSTQSITFPVTVVDNAIVDGNQPVTIMGVPTSGSASSAATVLTVTDNDAVGYAVTYDANGATSGTAPSGQTKFHNQDLILAGNSGNLTRSGYTFAGWNTAANGTGTNYAEGAAYTTNAPLALYAKWTPLTYTVSYNGNGNTSGTAPANQDKTHNVDLTLSGAGTLARTGYTFTGWNTAPNGSGTGFLAGATYAINSSVTLYAQWTLNTYTLSYASDAGGTLTGQTTQVVNHGGSGTQVTATPKTGRYFVKWSDDVMTASRTDTNVISNLSVTAIFAKTSYGTWSDSATFEGSFTDIEPTSNPDGDSLTNLQEFAFGTDPTSCKIHPLAFAVDGDVTKAGTPILKNFASAGNPPDFRAVFARRKDHEAAGLVYTLVFSADLQVWTPSAENLSVVSGPANPSEVEAVSVPFPLTVAVNGGGPQRAPKFFRVEVSSAP